MKQLDGTNPKVGRKWLKNVSKYARPTGQKHVAVAYETVDRPVADFIEKVISEGTNWLELKTMLKRIIRDLIDQNHGISLLTQCTQKDRK